MSECVSERTSKQECELICVRASGRASTATKETTPTVQSRSTERRLLCDLPDEKWNREENSTAFAFFPIPLFFRKDTCLNASAFKRFPNAFERGLVFIPIPLFHPEGHISNVRSQGPTSAVVMVPLTAQDFTASRHGLSYVTPSEPHTGANSRVHARGHVHAASPF